MPTWDLLRLRRPMQSFAGTHPNPRVIIEKPDLIILCSTYTLMKSIIVLRSNKAMYFNPWLPVIWYNQDKDVKALLILLLSQDSISTTTMQHAHIERFEKSKHTLSLSKYA